MTGKPSRKRTSPFAELGLVFLLAVVVLIFFADTNGYEGDDLNAIIPMLHLPDFLQTPEEIYKYDWQPLAYWTGYAAYKVTGTIIAIFLLPQIAIASAIAALYVIMIWYLRLSRLLFLPILMMFPEIIYTGLYLNSSALGYPFAVLAVLLAFSGSGWWRAVLAGLCLGVAVTMRLDYALVVVAILLLRFYQTGEIWDCALAGIIVVLWLLLSFSIGLLDWNRILEVYQASRAEIITRAQDGGWDAQTKLRVATVIFSPIGWLFLLISAGFVLIFGSRRLWWQIGLLLLSLAPFLYSMQNLLSVKYMMPLFALLPVFAAMLCKEMANQLEPGILRGASAVWVGMSGLLLLISVEPERTAPYIRVTATSPRVVGTHDGPRSWGAYLASFLRVERNPPVNAQTKRIEMADEFVAFAQKAGDQEIWLIGERGYFGPGGLAWNLIYVRLERGGYRGELTEDGTVGFSVPSGRIVLAPRGAEIPPNTCVVLLDTFVDLTSHIEQSCGRFHRNRQS